ncbi:MAG: hypothetical protein IJ115_01755 [Erysipelotrichaceae bacterium]|nr:hypothetical protein [Erysipelotrichaceae bacterium]
MENNRITRIPSGSIIRYIGETTEALVHNHEYSILRYSPNIDKYIVESDTDNCKYALPRNAFEVCKIYSVDVFEEQAVKFCYEKMKDQYDENGMPLFYHIISACSGDSAKFINPLFIIAETINYSGCTVDEIYENFSIFDIGGDLKSNIHNYIRSEEETEQEYISRISSDSCVSEYMRKLYFSFIIHAGDCIATTEEYKKKGLYYRLLDDIIFEHRNWEHLFDDFFSLEIRDRRSSNLEISTSKHDLNKQVTETYTISETTLQAIKEAILELRYPEILDFKFNWIRTNNSEPNRHYQLLSFYINEEGDYWNRCYRVDNRYDKSDQNTNRIISAKNQIFRLLEEEGITTVKRWYKCEYDQMSLF